MTATTTGNAGQFRHVSDNQYHYRFNSVDEMLNAARDVRYMSHSDCIDEQRAGFLGRAFSPWTWDELYRQIDIAEDAESQVNRMVADLRQQVSPPTTRRRRRKFSEDDGNDICWDRLRNGGAWWETRERKQTNSIAVVTLVYNVASGFRIDANDIQWRTAAAVAIAQLLAEASYTVRLVAASSQSSAYCCRSALLTECLVKHEREPLDVRRVANMGSGWVYRTVWWRVRFTEDKPSNVDDQLGTPRELTAQDKQLLDTVGAVHYLPQQVFSRHAAISAANQILTAIG